MYITFDLPKKLTMCYTFCFILSDMQASGPSGHFVYHQTTSYPEMETIEGNGFFFLIFFDFIFRQCQLTITKKTFHINVNRCYSILSSDIQANEHEKTSLTNKPSEHQTTMYSQTESNIGKFLFFSHFVF